MLSPYLGHCLLALRLEPLGQFIPNPVDREDLVVDGALGDSWHGLLRHLSEWIEKRGNLLSETILFQETGASFLRRVLSLRRLLIDLGGSTRALLVRLGLALRGWISRLLIIEVAHIHLRQFI